MKMIKLAVLIIFVYMLTHLFSFTLFIMRPLWIEPETIKNRDLLFHVLGEPKYKYDIKGFVVWEKYDNLVYSIIEYRNDEVIVASNIFKVNNVQIFKNSKIWDGTNLYQYITVWPYGRFRILAKE
ncbi:hypothetical protein SEENIN0B_01129 [Salmonella enterica subsp. enterica serovar Infantis str. SARB27]|uniref:Uncharacterized protein n=2 Tax=Salmonella infantis TaxID=595 RepID=A0A5Y7AMV2_SALIN|nr:hypothetical protein [Salmonella enterica]ECK9504162.1 hypothetical protein [Salmonella enterica subsp. enterica serovar Infantis str. CFSAN000522]EHB41278.1 hypothetical protein SEENIN0B_01129 [Salmonella enterica subsp. enterica serovar Infantis str. SARB27]QCV24267.1 hypothetical protein FE265_05410 [Salmonella enterica subsp. enterica serovar Infantis]QCV28746.1 hypothetical protein FE168_05400 [Salmonella enterica subsp. enterica serovar Infantis]HAE6952196.1 hypothetical protein [Salm